MFSVTFGMIPTLIFLPGHFGATGANEANQCGVAVAAAASLTTRMF